MSEQNKGVTPYKVLGNALKKLREKLRENLAEVSGAVEIDMDMLNSIERGVIRPSEDILLLLMAHFGIQDDEATKLWTLAGYDHQTASPTAVNDISNIMIMPVDTRIVYTDMVNVMVNNYGVIMNFMQSIGPNNQPVAIARVGMSKEHAKSVLEVLKQTLEQSEPKSLPAPQKQKDNRKQN